MRTFEATPAAADTQRNHDEIDLRNLGRGVWRNRFRILVPALFVAVAALFLVGRMTPLYQSEARILIEAGDNVYTRPTGTADRAEVVIDEQAVQSQVQLLISRNLAASVVEKAGLAQKPEFDELSKGLSVPKWFMTMFGIVRDPRRMSLDERVLDTYYKSLTVYPIGRSRVIAVQFSSSNPELAAQVTNLIADEFLRFQQNAKQNTTRDASEWLGREIEELRKRVAESEGRVETFRAKSNLFMGANNATITTQQLGELNTQLTEARGAQAEAQAKNALLKDLLRGNVPSESLDIANSELIRRLAEQRVLMRAAVARESRTLLPNHPRMKELTAQLANLDEQIRDEALGMARAFENEAKVSTSRVESLQKSIEAQKKLATVANEQDVQLRALEREAKAQRDLLEQFLTRYREANSRERSEALPPDARIISRASESNTPYFPKPLPIVIVAFFGVAFLASAFVVASELMRASNGNDSGPMPSAPTPRTRDDRGPSPAPRDERSRRIVSDAPAGQKASFRAEDAGERVSAKADIPEEPFVLKPDFVQGHVAPVLSIGNFPPEAEIASAARIVGGSHASSESKNLYGSQASQAEAEAAQQELRLGDSQSASADPFFAERLERMSKPKASRETVHVPPVSGDLPVFGKLKSSGGDAPHNNDIEAADVRLVDDLATRLAEMPRGGEALAILVVGAHAGVDSGLVALKLVRSLANADRKAVLLDAGSGSAEVIAAAPQPNSFGLSDLLEDKVSFSQAIHLDRASSAHLIPAGVAELNVIKRLPAVEVMFGALGFTYDFIVVAGPSCDTETYVSALARRCKAAILVSAERSGDKNTVAAHDLLQAQGLSDVVVLLAQPQVTSAMSRLPAATTPRRSA
jgi:uncharacterized protein involved in exopolysaccharide biosynthesis/Mrp family chromosome partitioning ATPase